MSTGVFANGLEISCKSSSGKSPASFPDPCFSPPSPSAGWIVIPYANTAKASTATNTSKTVFIGGKPVMLKDKSYFKTSTGDEGAAGPKGIASGVKKGKAYYISWSSDVKIEGYNVCRHTDLMTHNHGSPANTGAWHFASTKAAKNACVNEKKRIEEECGIDKKEQEKYQEKRKRINDKRKGKKKKGPYKTRQKTWKDNHCLPLLIKPNALGDSDVLETIEKGIEEFKQEIIDDLPNQAADAAIDGVLDKKCHLLWFPALVLACKAAKTAHAAYEIYDSVSSMLGALEGLKNIKSAIDALQSETGSLADLKDKILPTPNEQKAIEDFKQIKNAYAEGMDNYAHNNDCLAARKCMLTPMHNEEKVDGKTKQDKNEPQGKGDLDLMTKLGLNDPSGCCPGQTKHHLVPDSWAKEAGCDKYSYGGAPTVCTEGDNQNRGSHGRIHTSLNDALADFKRDNPGKVLKSGVTKATKTDVIGMAAKSHQNTFRTGDIGCTSCGKPVCSEKCIKKQLEGYFKGCKKFNAEPIPQKKDSSTGTADTTISM